MLSQKQIHDFRQKIWGLYKTNKRDFPWRETQDPYKILVSEIMLQQTQVSRVLSKYEQFIKTFPTYQALAHAPLREILTVWQGLGYNRRALYLKEIARKIIQKQNTYPRSNVSIHHCINPTYLQTLPGIGKNTAGAIYVFSANKPFVFIETNIRRVYIHEFFTKQQCHPRFNRGHPENHEVADRISHQLKDSIVPPLAGIVRTISDKDLYPLIEQTMDTNNPRDWHYALMDYGSYLPKIVTNPNTKSKHYTKQSKFEGSLRQVRGKILKILLLEKSLLTKDLEEKVAVQKDLFAKALNQLLEEKFIVINNRRIKIDN